MKDPATLLTILAALITAFGGFASGIANVIIARKTKNESGNVNDDAAVRVTKSDDFAMPVTKRSVRRRWGYIGLGAGVVSLLIAVGVGVPAFVSRPAVALSGSPAPGGTRQSSIAIPNASTPPSPTTAKAQITYPPHEGAPGAPVEVSQQRGLVVRGTATGLQNEYLWLFDFDLSTATYFGVSDRPAPILVGSWAVEDAPIGNKGVKKEQYVVVIRANATCNKALEQMVVAKAKANTDEPFSFVSPPDGCTVDDKAPVKIDMP